MKKIAVFSAIILCYGLLGTPVGLFVFNMVTLFRLAPFTISANPESWIFYYACGSLPALVAGLFLALRAVYKIRLSWVAYYGLAFWFAFFNPLPFLLLLFSGKVVVAEFMALIDPFVAIVTALIFHLIFKRVLENTPYSLSVS